MSTLRPHTDLSAAMLPGIDVSAWQPHIDWSKVAGAGHRYAFIKATEGSSYVSPTFAPHRAQARAEGLLVGAYHFARWEHDNARAQAEHFARIVGEAPAGELPPVLDLEWITGKKLAPPLLVAWALDFLERVEALLGRRPILYTGPSFWRWKLLPADAAQALTAYPLWVAKYQQRPPTMQGAPDWRWDWWQFTGSGAVPGVTVKAGGGPLAKCDVNVFRGTERELRLFAGLDDKGCAG